MEHDGAGWISYGVLALVLLALTAALWRSGFLGRLMRLVEETMLGNWQLALLGAAAIALSLASGYTTFDGLRNFTSAPLLSVLVAFGIQGVMLIVSWLIGESFATGMGRKAARPGAMSAREATLGVGFGAVLVGLAFCWALNRYDAIGLTGGAGGSLQLRADWQRVADVALAFLMALALLGLIVLAARRGGDIARSYVQAVRLIVGNAALWAMLLACMGASVLFSFDSHFNAIFPAEQRKRAAEIRTLSQIAATVADIGERAQKVQAAETGRLFETEGWKTYDAQLAALAELARGTQAEIAAVLLSKLEERQRGIGEQQERIAGSQRSQSALLRKRDELEAELQRLEASIGALEAELAKAQGGVRREEAGNRRQGDRGLRRGRRRRGHAEARQGPHLAPACGGGGGAAAQAQARRRAAPQGGAKPARCGLRAHRRPQARDRHHRRGGGQVQGRHLRRRAPHQGGAGGRRSGRRRGRPTYRSCAPAGGLRARPRRLPPTARRRGAGGRPDAVPEPDRCALRRGRGQGEGARHRLRPQGRRRGRSAPVRSQRRPPGVRGGVRRRRQAAAGGGHRRASGLRPQVPAGFGAREQGHARLRRPLPEHRDEPGRQGAPLRRQLERAPRRQPPRLSGARAGHRRRLPGADGRPVRRGGRTVAAVRRAEPHGTQRRAAGGHRQERAGCGPAGDRRAGPCRHAARAR